MLVLFETPAGYSLFKVNDAQKLAQTDPEDIYDKFFADGQRAAQSLQLVSFQPFADTAEAVTAATSIMEGKVGKSLQSFLKRKLKKLQMPAASGLAVADKALAISLKEARGLDTLKVVHDSKTAELFRGIRCYMDELMGGDGGAVGGLSPDDMRAMQLGLSHSLSRYKLKFSADKVDTMVIQAVGLLDELDKEINTYAMRVKEWYGWHFPELQALVGDNVMYSKLVLSCGLRPNFKDTDLSSILEDENQAATVKEAAEISMGTDITEFDILNIKSLAEQVLSMTEYRAQLFEYLKNRMNAIAPNLTILVGELVGARLIAHAGSLMNLAKQPASTVQIIGAEKALFRALKTKHDTPKYGLIYHASLIGQAAPKNKGKISRVLACKAALAIRVDALSDEINGEPLDTTIGFEGRATVEARLRQLEGGGGSYLSGTDPSLTAQKTAKYNPVAAKAAAPGPTYNDASDVVLDDVKVAPASSSKKDKKKDKKEKKKRPAEENGDEKELPIEQAAPEAAEEEEDESHKKSDKKRKADKSTFSGNHEGEDEAKKEKSPKKAKKAEPTVTTNDEEEQTNEKPSKKAKKAKKEKRKSKD